MLSISRRAALAVLACTFLLSGCVSPPPPAEAEQRVFAEPEDGAYPVTIEHAYGSTEVTTQPKRVVAIGWSGADIAIQFGTVPVAQGHATGIEADYYPWVSEAIEKLGAPFPSVDPSLERGEVDLEYVLMQQPDLIVAINSGITEAEYKALSEIAPTIAFPSEPWATTVDEHIQMMGAALGRPAYATQIEKDTTQRIADVAAAHPELSGVTYLHSFLPSDDGQVVVFGSVDPRAQILEALGLEPLAGTLELQRKAGDPASFTVSMEQFLQLNPDVHVVISDEDTWREAVAANAAFQSWAPVSENRVALIDDPATGLALATATPLGIDWGIDAIADRISRVVTETRGEGGAS
ncbi:ABC transporter substrate-binding protein [Pseudoglutamicibacter albus]|uniref:ABC transporter substrate-binding protein n=1 Tax=Micrococcales TaxID=85006 RepID=UPI000C756E1A|nr:ABC transporter substrate-binding protein [Pseudoglutamicibacter albus]PKY79732.1 iron siderophore-binding protein [Pseudoglutamicibacter albus]WIK83484.1 ABC transporter substrate-binding protein [Pseudoglutamicibacter albus]